MGSVAQPESDILPNRSAVDFRKQYFPPRVTRSGISKEMLMLILCTGLGSPPFPRTGGFRVDKHLRGTDVALEADATVGPSEERFCQHLSKERSASLALGRTGSLSHIFQSFTTFVIRKLFLVPH